PTVDDILPILAKATKLSFMADANVDSSTPLFESISWVNIPAWSAMDQLAECAQVEGSWEKTDEGYRLRGKVGTDLPGPTRWPYIDAIIRAAALVFAYLI